MILVLGNNIEDILESIFRHICHDNIQNIVFFSNNKKDKKTCIDMYLQNKHNIQQCINGTIIFNKYLIGNKNIISIIELTNQTILKQNTDNTFVYTKCIYMNNKIKNLINFHKNYDKIIIAKSKYKTSSKNLSNFVSELGKNLILYNHNTLKE